MNIPRSDLLTLVSKGHSLDMMAEVLCTNRSAIRRALKRHGLKTQNKRGRKVKFSEDENKQWDTIGIWPIGIHFDSLTFKPSIQRKPVMPEANSGCGNSSAMVLG